MIVDLSERTVCVKGECLEVAIGKSGFETPTGRFKLEPHNIFLNGFYWRCPRAVCGLGSKVYAPHENPLGQVWIGVVDTPKGFIGFHESPNKKVALAQQYSHGCLRMRRAQLWKLVYLIYLHHVKYTVIIP